MAQTVAELEAKLTLNLESFKAELARLDSMLGGAAMTVGRFAGGFALAQVGVQSLEQALRTLDETVIGLNSMLERAQLSFTYLMGSADNARAHIAGLIDMAQRSPFPIDQWLNASRVIQGMGLNAAFVPSVLKQISDAASAMNLPLDETTRAVGRFMSMIAGGTGGTGGIGQGARFLMSMGLITGPMLAEIRNMETAGASADQILQRFLQMLGRFGGASEEAAQTWSGLMARIRDSLTVTAGAGFRPIFDRLEQMHKQFGETFASETVKDNLINFSKFAVGVFDRIGAAIGGANSRFQQFLDWMNRQGLLGLGLGGPAGPATAAVPSAAGLAGFTADEMQRRAAPSGSMFERAAPTAQQLQALAQAQRLLADLNPALDAADKKVLELATRFAELAKEAGPLAGQVKALGMEASRAAIYFGGMKVFLDIKDAFDKAMPTFDAIGKEEDEINKKFQLASEQVLPHQREAVKRLGEVLIQSLQQHRDLATEIKGVGAAYDSAEAAALAFGRFETQLVEPFRKAEDAAREFQRTLATIPEFAAILRGAGVQGVDVTGTQQSAVQGRIQTLLTQIADWNEQLKSTVRGPEGVRTLFDDLTEGIEKAALEVDVLKTKLAGLQELNTLKGIVSDVFSALERAISTSITGVIQGTTTMKDAFNNLGQSIIISINELFIKRAFKQLEEAFNSMLDSMDTRAMVSTALRFIAGLFGAAAPSAAPASSPPVWNEPTAMQSGGIVMKPTLATVGEHGPEAVIPLDHAQQYLGGGSAMVQVTVINNAAGTETQTKESTGPMGERQIEIMINGVVKKDIAQGGYDRLLQTTFGVTRQGINR